MIAFWRRHISQRIFCVVIAFSCASAHALEIEPAVGAAFEYTNNVEQVPSNKSGETIAVAYVGAKAVENEGSLTYDALATLNRYKYLQDTFESSRYFNLITNADWEISKERFNLRMNDIFTQRSIAVLGSNTPDNIQDTNAFNLSGDLLFKATPRNTFTVTPSFSQYYFEIQRTNNKQYSLAGNWSYSMNRLSNLGLSLSTRRVGYTETALSGQAIEDTRFSTLSFQFSRQTTRSSFSTSLGSTSVKREAGAETKGFIGNISWRKDVSSRSSISAGASTGLTDTSSISSGAGGGLPDDNVQVTTDVIRNSVFNAAYSREDATVRTSVSFVYRKVKYSESPLDQVNKTLRVTVDYPISQRLTGGVYAIYDSSERLITEREDEVSTLGGNLSYNFSAKLYGTFDLTYRNKESTFDTENYDEYSVYLSVVYGFGQVYRPTRISSGF